MTANQKDELLFLEFMDAQLEKNRKLTKEDLVRNLSPQIGDYKFSILFSDFLAKVYIRSYQEEYPPNTRFHEAIYERYTRYVFSIEGINYLNYLREESDKENRETLFQTQLQRVIDSIINTNDNVIETNRIQRKLARNSYILVIISLIFIVASTYLQRCS